MTPLTIRIGETWNMPFWLAQNSFQVTNATDTTPIVVTTNGNHGFATGDNLVVNIPAANTSPVASFAFGAFVAEAAATDSVTLTGSTATGFGAQTAGTIGKVVDATGGSITFTAVDGIWAVGQSLFTTATNGTTASYQPTMTWNTMASGYFSLSFTAAQTFAMLPGNYYLRVFFTDSTGAISEELNYPVQVTY